MLVDLLMTNSLVRGGGAGPGLMERDIMESTARFTTLPHRREIQLYCCIKPTIILVCIKKLTFLYIGLEWQQWMVNELSTEGTMATENVIDIQWEGHQQTCHLFGAVNN